MPWCSDSLRAPGRHDVAVGTRAFPPPANPLEHVTALLRTREPTQTETLKAQEAWYRALRCALNCSKPTPSPDRASAAAPHPN